MEKIKRCRKCGARLLEHEKRCPVCGTPVGLDKEVDIIKEEQIIEPEKVDEFIAADKTEQTLLKSNESAQNYWRSKKIWAVFIVLIVVTTVMRQYVINNPIKLAENDNSNTITNDYSDSKISINKNTGKYSQATNINYLGISYVNDNAVYLMMNSELLKYDRSFNNRELVLEQAVTVFSEDEQWYYYLDENNDYIRMDKKTKAEDILLKNVYYVHNLGDKVYYQNDSDGETIHCLELETNQDHKISDEVSYSIVVDEEKGRIFYINKNNELVSIALDGSDKKNLANNTNVYTYGGEYLYYINNDGLVKSDLEGQSKVIYESNNLSLVNLVEKKLVIQDKNIIYTMDLDGKDKKKLYTMDIGGSLTFEVVGDKLLVLTKGNSDSVIGYEIVGFDGKRHILDDENQPTIKGNEF